jgi:hypothetical protein
MGNDMLAFWGIGGRVAIRVWRQLSFIVSHFLFIQSIELTGDVAIADPSPLPQFRHFLLLHLLNQSIIFVFPISQSR